MKYLLSFLLVILFSVSAFAGGFQNKEIRKVIHPEKAPVVILEPATPSIPEVLMSKPMTIAPINYAPNGLALGLVERYLELSTPLLAGRFAIGYANMNGDQQGLLAYYQNLLASEDRRSAIFTGLEYYSGRPDQSLGLPIGASQFIGDFQLLAEGIIGVVPRLGAGVRWFF
jgi:hypothetical protein